MSEAAIETLTKSLEDVGVSAEIIGGTINASRGQGRQAQRANIDPSAMLTALAPLDGLAHRRRLGGYVQGVELALSEPKRSRADGWSYTESAGSLFPVLVVDSFVDGVLAASGEQPFVTPFEGDLVLAHVIVVTGGWRVLPQSQVARWGVSGDQIVAAGRSLLFHRTTHVAARPYREDLDGVEMLRVGDGFDAARATIVADLWYDELRAGFRFSLPEPDLLLFVRDTAQLDALRAATTAALEATSYPLSEAIWRFDAGGRPVLAP